MFFITFRHVLVDILIGAQKRPHRQNRRTRSPGPNIALFEGVTPAWGPTSASAWRRLRLQTNLEQVATYSSIHSQRYAIGCLCYLNQSTNRSVCSGLALGIAWSWWSRRNWKMARCCPIGRHLAWIGTGIGVLFFPEAQRTLAKSVQVLHATVLLYNVYPVVKCSRERSSWCLMMLWDGSTFIILSIFAKPPVLFRPKNSQKSTEQPPCHAVGGMHHDFKHTPL